MAATSNPHWTATTGTANGQTSLPASSQSKANLQHQHSYGRYPSIPSAGQHLLSNPTPASSNYPTPRPRHAPQQPTWTAPRPTPPAPQPAARPPQQHASTPASSGTPAIAPRSQPLYTNPNACPGCGERLGFGTYVNAMGCKWHAKCFVCPFCSQPLGTAGNSIFATGQDDGRPYHLECYKHKYHPVCKVCGMFIPERHDGRVEYKENPFWREKYCPRHQDDSTPICCACSRLQDKNQEYVSLSDGRCLCLQCLDTIVIDTKDVQPLYEEVLQFYRRMGMPHPVKAPLMLVDGPTLNDCSSREGKDTRTGGPMFHVRGLTLATVYRSIPSIVRAMPGVNSLNVNTVSVPLTDVTCSVTGMLVMYGLPRLLTACIIAHELMHAWLRMKNVAHLDQQVEEGLCQLMAYIWLDQQHDKLAGNSMQQQLASYFAYQIREDTSMVYGDGFRMAYDAFQRVGLVNLINNVLKTGRFN